MRIPSNFTNIAYVSIGSNMGDRLCVCRKGIELLANFDGLLVDGLSNFYFTEPIEFTDQSWFVNAVIKIITDLDPVKLLSLMNTVECRMGRIRSNIRYGPRMIDFDIIFYNDEIINTPELVVPHPRMHYREFVLRPLCDLAPDMIHPVMNKKLKQLLDEIQGGKQQCIKINSTDDIPISILDQVNKADQEEVNDEVLY